MSFYTKKLDWLKKGWNIKTVLLASLLTASCSSHNINYNRNKILKKFSADYTIYVDDKITDLQSVYLDPQNIESVVIEKDLKELRIKQHRSLELSDTQNWGEDSIDLGHCGFKKIGLIIIDGIAIADSVRPNLYIDPKAINSIAVLSEKEITKMRFCKAYDGLLIMITTK